MRSINPNPFGDDELKIAEPVNVKFCADIKQAECRELERMLERLIERGAVDIRVLFSSNGGSINRGIQLHNSLKALPANLTMHNIGVVESIANVVFMAGKRRFSELNATFMIHGTTIHFEANKKGEVALNEKDLNNALKKIQNDNHRVAKTIANHSKMTVEEVLNAMSDTDTFFSATEAKERGLIHEIQDAEKVSIGNLYSIEG